MKILDVAKQFVIVALGVVIPIFLLMQAYAGLSSLATDVGYVRKSENVSELFLSAKKSINNVNDYALLSLLYAEHANQKTMLNKQVMKVSIMQIGFAVLSVGMMFIVLGIKEGGAEGGIGIGEIKFDFKTGSTGLVVFVIGALMATAGGVLKNDYDTVPIPGYAYDEVKPEYWNVIIAFRRCKRESKAEKFESCLKTAIDKGVLDE